ncbi:MAG: cation:proton antiporter [Candidatus Nitrosopolaris sp.]
MTKLQPRFRSVSNLLRSGEELGRLVLLSIVLKSMKVDYHRTRTTESVNLSFFNEADHFIIIFFGGSAIGLVNAAATHRLHTLMNGPLSKTSLTISTAFGSMVLANSLGVSGIVAVPVARLYFGKEGKRSQ